MNSFSELPLRLQQKIEVSDACWEWLAARHPDGYGKVYWQGKVEYAHRVIYELLVGAIPDGLVSDHLCRNRGCVNPRHLEPVTQRVNLLRGETLIAENMTKSTCPRGHPYYVTRKGYRRCRTCERGWARDYHARQLGEAGRDA